MAVPLLVNVLELLRRPGSSRDVESDVECEAFDFDDPRIVDRTVAVRLRLESLSDGITVAGTVTFGLRDQCRRCLREIDDDVSVAVSELFQVTLQDPDAYPIEQDQAALLPMVRENILLAVPPAPLCRPDCAGLCPVCGRDLNEGRCDCPSPAGDARWAALDQLKERLSREDPAGGCTRFDGS